MLKEKVIVDTDSEKVTIGIDGVTFAIVHYRKNIFRNGSIKTCLPSG